MINATKEYRAVSASETNKKRPKQNNAPISAPISNEAPVEEKEVQTTSATPDAEPFQISDELETIKVQSYHNGTFTVSAKFWEVSTKTTKEIFKKLPDKYLDNYKNPCFWQKFDGPLTSSGLIYHRLYMISSITFLLCRFADGFFFRNISEF